MIAARQSACPGPTRRGTATIGSASSQTVGEPGVDSYVGWTYIGAEIAGSTLLDGKINGVNWPLPKGRYSVYLLKDDGYEILARADFSIR
jgi:hypothetical protein